MTTTFHLPDTSLPEARVLFGDWRCRIERMDDKSVNIVFFDQEEWNRFTDFCDENDVVYEMV